MRVPRWQVWSLRGGFVAVLIGLWLYANGPGGTSPLLLPQLPQVIEQFITTVTTPAIRIDIAVTVLEILVGFAVAAVLGLAVGFWAARSAFRAKVIEPMLAWGYMAPLVLFYPVFILWFGVGVSSKAAFAALSAFFPIAYNSLRGFRSISPVFLRVARSFGASSAQTDRLIKFPAALPLVTSGLRIGAASSMITVILAEMISSTRGLGYELSKTSQTFAVADTFALILLLLILVVIFQILIGKCLQPFDWGSRKTSGR